MSIKWLFAVVLAGIGASAIAAEGPPKVIVDALQLVAPGVKAESVVPAELPGFYQAVIHGRMIYVSNDGKYLIQGSIFDIQAKVNLSEKGMASLRKATIAQIPHDKQLVFAPANPKYTVTVFTDVDCPYCREFHKQIADYNKRGIAVNYVLFPLNIHPGSDKHAQSVWCAKDRNATYTAAMTAGTPPPVLTCSNPVAELTEVGMSMGVEGTPAIFSADGTQLGGYLPPVQLEQRLDQLAKTGDKAKDEKSAGPKTAAK